MNLFSWTAVYVTIQDVKDSTWKAWIIALTDAEIQELIYKAQYRIDNYIWSYWVPFVDGQEFIFPVLMDDGTSYIPTDIKQASIFVINQIFENGDTITSSQTSWWEIVQEVVGDRRIVYSEWTTSNNKLSILWIPAEAEAILRKYRQVFFKSKI